MSVDTAVVVPWRNTYALLKEQRVLTHNVVLGAGTITAGILELLLAERATQPGIDRHMALVDHDSSSRPNASTTREAAPPR